MRRRCGTKRRTITPGYRRTVLLSLHRRCPIPLMAMTYRSIRLDVHDGVAVITLDRPETRNAFTGPMGKGVGRRLPGVRRR